MRQRLLTTGDQIAVGGSLFLFQMEGTVAAAISPVQLDDASSATGHEQQLRHDELLYLHPESLAALPQSTRLDRALNATLLRNQHRHRLDPVTSGLTPNGNSSA